MRDYGKISPLFWTQGTGKALRKHPEAQIVALYLMTAPLSEMTGVFYCPMFAIAGETGLGEEGASKGLRRLIEVGFCTYDPDSEIVFVHEMAVYQIGEKLSVNDNQVKSVRKAYSAMKGEIKAKFYARYKEAFHLGDESLSQAPSKPLRSQEQEQEQEQKQEQTTSVPNGTGASAPPDGLTAKDAIFSIGVPWLVNNLGKDKEGNIRSLLGGAVKQLGDEGAWEITRQCMDEKPVEPIAWLAAALNAKLKTTKRQGAKGPAADNFAALNYGKAGKL